MRCKNFVIQQLVPPALFNARGEACWELLDSAALMSLDQLYGAFGRLTVNNWHTGGQFKESGLRLWATTTGAPFSQHKYGRAFDCKPIDTTPQAMYEAILKDPKSFPFITTLEDIAYTKSWLHFDTRNNPSTGIRIVKP